MLQPGTRCVLGELETGGYGIWSPFAGGRPVVTFPPDLAGWQQAIWQFQQWEQPPAPPRSPWLHSASVAVVMVILYLAYHAYRYHACLVSPGIFSWPSSCI